ncbi:PD-(D/E)XK nuclease family transposase [Tychonema sp. BBK16]|uniref:PD-(D/E)XK nuclease family transposase n=1 Tax=Tychonema sp. BBK16 TaxID=2699888 RepID=UPI0030D76928
MEFINPKIEFGFKKIFASPQSKEVLMSFLNAMLYNGEPTILQTGFIVGKKQLI